MLKLKNIPISVKLWLIIVPAIISLTALLYYFSYRSNRISAELTTLFYDELYLSSSKILNADRVSIRRRSWKKKSSFHNPPATRCKLWLIPSQKTRSRCRSGSARPWRV